MKWVWLILSCSTRFLLCIFRFNIKFCFVLTCVVLLFHHLHLITKSNRFILRISKQYDAYAVQTERRPFIFIWCSLVLLLLQLIRLFVDSFELVNHTTNGFSSEDQTHEIIKKTATSDWYFRFFYCFVWTSRIKPVWLNHLFCVGIQSSIFGAWAMVEWKSSDSCCWYLWIKNNANQNLVCLLLFARSQQTRQRFAHILKEYTDFYRFRAAISVKRACKMRRRRWWWWYLSTNKSCKNESIIFNCMYIVYTWTTTTLHSSNNHY